MAPILGDDDKEHPNPLDEHAELAVLADRMHSWARQLCASAQQVEDQMGDEPGPSAGRAYVARLRLAAMLLDTALTPL